MRVLVVLGLAACGRIEFAVGADAAPIGDAPYSPYAQAVLADQPLAYLRLGDLSDRAGTLGSGTASGGVTVGVAGLIANETDGAAVLDGATGYIRFADDPRLRLTSALTLEAWIKPGAFDNPAGAPFPRVLHKGTTADTGFALMVYQNGTANDGVVRVELEGTTTLGLSGTTTLLPGEVHHVAATWNGGEIRVYLDGQVDAVVASTGSIPATADPLDIGRRPDGQRYWQGVLDDVAIYSTALSAARIAAHYAAGRP